MMREHRMSVITWLVVGYRIIVPVGGVYDGSPVHLMLMLMSGLGALIGTRF